MEWRIDDAAGSTELRQLARFHPRGVAGRAYWWVLLPIHKVIWKQLAERLVQRTEAIAAQSEELAPVAQAVGEHEPVR